MRKIKLIMMLMVMITISIACTDGFKAKLGGLGDEFKIEMLNCDGTVARTYTSTGKVSSEANSDGYYFMDKTTNTLVEITGRLVITKL
jgi:hypothetical protein